LIARRIMGAKISESLKSAAGPADFHSFSFGNAGGDRQAPEKPSDSRAFLAIRRTRRS